MRGQHESGSSHEIVSRRRLPPGLRGFGAAGLVAMVLVIAGLVVGTAGCRGAGRLWAWASKTPWRDLGFVNARGVWAAVIVFGALFGIAFKIA